MKIACLYFPTSSVGGIATNTEALRQEAKRRGDTFHVLVCANASTHSFETYNQSKLIRGGDTFINIDGYASHHINRLGTTILTLNRNYDLVYLAFLCPHPTKSYGDTPHFLSLIERIKLPIVGRISDGYFETYAEWGNATAARCARMIIAMEPYLPEGFIERFPAVPVVYGRPFDPVGTGYDKTLESHTRNPNREFAWISQWKAIKGIHKFLELMPLIEGEQTLLSNGILYYQKRTEPDWKAAVGTDTFKPEFSGNGKATFFGWLPLSQVRRILARAWFMPEFQGLGKPKNEAYRKGATNNTTMEALYYGCTPVIPQVVIDNAGIPPESAIGVGDFLDAIPALNGPRAERPELGKQWVMDNFNVSMIYDRFFRGLV